jgi:hypothetical protein
MKLFDEEFDENVVQEHADNHEQKIAEQLNAPLEYRPRENDESIQQVSGGKADQEGNNESGYMGADWTSQGVHYLFFQHKIVSQEVKKNIEHGVASPTDSIPERLFRNPVPKWSMEKIDHGYHAVPDHSGKSKESLT